MSHHKADLPEKRSELTPPSNGTPTSQGQFWELLDWVEDALLRMIVGIFRFIFRRLPLYIYDTIKHIFPTFAKFLKVCVLATFVGALVAGPPILAIMFGLSENTWSRLILFGWPPLAIIGMLWGLLRVRLRRRGLHHALKQGIFGKDDGVREDKAVGQLPIAICVIIGIVTAIFFATKYSSPSPSVPSENDSLAMPPTAPSQNAVPSQDDRRTMPFPVQSKSGLPD